jgi:hypothetical protein
MMHSNILCTCEHADTEHLQNIGACMHKEAGGFCGCDHFYPFRVRVPLDRPMPPVPMKNSVLTPWSRQKQA